MPKPIKKEPLPLKKSLDLLDEKALAPYKVVSKPKISNQEVIDSLGAQDYIQWILEDADAAVDSAVRNCSLFITYYDLPDRIPHVPEECYTGGGHQRLTSDSVTFEINKQGIMEKIPGRYLVFASTNSNYWGMDTKFSVLYLFNVNESYANSREDARFALNKNIFSKYSYFSKVEWKFFNIRFGKPIYPGKEEAIAASQKLLSIILPILEKEHWPIVREENAVNSK
ncbi:MAG: hypothetical protein FVQ85_04990 [Planctomycetes bacterium]|nr:hypothetical protein [Planctomycetota bacterium]